MNFSKACVVFLLIFSFSLLAQNEQLSVKIDRKISDWHQAAAEADLETYSSFMTKDAVFIGTDPTEYWIGQDFIDFAKPYFDRGKAWTFYKLNRHIYIGSAKQTAWFDELLDTPMGICRGSGILVKQKDQWKIKHYVLSITIPNENVESIKKLNRKFNQSFIKTQKAKY